MTIQKFLSVVFRLGGPDISPEEIEWATDLPAGKQLMEWFENQLVNEPEGHNEMDLVAWKDIALERNEFSSLRSAEAFDLDPSTKSTLPKHSGYTLPSEIKARIRTMETESQLLEDEVKLLKHRLQQTKTATKNTSTTLQTLGHVLETTRSDISQKQGKLGELSVDADTAVSLSTDTALRVISTLNSNSNQVYGTHQKSPTPSTDPGPHGSLSAFAGLRSQIIKETDLQISLVDEARASLPKSEEVSREMTRLHYVFNEHNNARTPDDEAEKLKLTRAAEEAAYSEELMEMCKHLEMGGAIEDLLDDNTDEAEVELDVQGELARVWACDQAAILAARVEILEKAIYAFKQHLIPPLSKFCSPISNLDAHIREVEVLICALIEELDEIVNDIHLGKMSSKSGEKLETNTTQLDKQMMDLLKKFEGLRSVDAAPLVLLDQADVIRELSSCIAQAKHVNHKQDEWITSLPKQLSYLADTHSQLLVAAYSNSPVNTSPPFAPPQSVLALEIDTRKNAGMLQQEIVRLQKECGMSSKMKRKAGAFVQKWRDPL